MSKVNTNVPVESSSGCTMGTPRHAETSITIKKAICRLRQSLEAWLDRRFQQFDKEGSLVKDDARMDIGAILQSLEKLQDAVPRLMILPGNRRKAIESIDRIRRSVDQITQAIDMIRLEDRAAEATRILAEVFAEQQKMVDEINAQIPDESTLLHIRDRGQIALLIIGVGAFVALNVLSLGLPLLAIVGISVMPMVAGFLWNRIYDRCTTPCPVWKPMRDVLGKIRLSLENANMFASTVINRLEPRLDRTESQVRALEVKVAQVLETKVTQVLETKVSQVTSEISELKDCIRLLLESNQKLCADNRQMSADNQRIAADNQRVLALLHELICQQGKAKELPRTNSSANDEMPTLHVLQFG